MAEKSSETSSDNGKEYEIFISYKSEDRPRVQPVIDRLEKLGFKVWVDYRQLYCGGNWSAHLAKGIKSSRCMVLFMSKGSMQSAEVAKEVNLAMAVNRIPVLPMRLEDTNYGADFEYHLAGHQYYDLFPQFDLGYNRLVQSLELFGIKPSGSASSPETPKESQAVAKSGGKGMIIGGAIAAALALGLGTWFLIPKGDKAPANDISQKNLPEHGNQVPATRPDQPKTPNTEDPKAEAKQRLEQQKADEESKRIAKENADKQAAEQKRLADEKAAKDKADAEIKQRADAKAAMDNADAEVKRLADEKAAKEKSDAEAKRLADEKAAKEKSDAEAKRLADAKAAKEKADAEEKRLADEKAAKEKADAEVKRLADEKLAKEKAEAETKRLAEEKAAQEKADAEAKKKAEEKLQADLKTIDDSLSAKKWDEANTAIGKLPTESQAAPKKRLGELATALVKENTSKVAAILRPCKEAMGAQEWDKVTANIVKSVPLLTEAHAAKAYADKDIVEKLTQVTEALALIKKSVPKE